LVSSPRSPLRLDFNAQDRGRVVDSVGQVAEQSPSRKDGLIFVSAGWVLHPCSCAALRIETTHHRRTLAVVSDDSLLLVFLHSFSLPYYYRRVSVFRFFQFLSFPLLRLLAGWLFFVRVEDHGRLHSFSLHFRRRVSNSWSANNAILNLDFRFRLRLSRRQFLSSSIQPASSLLDAGRQPPQNLQERLCHRTTLDGTTSKFEGGAPPQAKFIDLWFSPALTVITCSNPSRW
jgi:hypothetical protein